MKKILCFVLVTFICHFPKTSSALTLSFEPETWYEINTQSGTTLIAEPATMQIGLGAYQARAFWEYSIFDILNKFETIDSAFVEFNNSGYTNNVQFYTFDGEGQPSFASWFNIAITDTWQNMPLYGFDDPFSRGPESLIDFTTGLNSAIAQDFSFLGIGVFEPSMSGVPNMYSIVDSSAYLYVTGTPAPIPEPTTMLLLGTGLVGVAGAARRKKKNQA